MESINQEPTDILKHLFDKAQSIDEFEFCFCLMRIRGYESPGWNPWLESRQLIQQVGSLLQAPLENDLKIRLLLFLYCHVTEMDDLYNFVANLLRVSQGERYSILPFPDRTPFGKQKVVYPHTKIARIVKWANEANFPDVGRIVEEMFVKNVRNAFYHSDYILHENHFNIDRGQGVIIDGIRTRSIPLEWLIPKMELAINLTLATINLSIEYIRSYKEEKIVPARMGPDDTVVDAVLMVKEGYGLIGVRSADKNEGE